MRTNCGAGSRSASDGPPRDLRPRAWAARRTRAPTYGSRRQQAPGPPWCPPASAAQTLMSRPAGALGRRLQRHRSDDWLADELHGKRQRGARGIANRHCQTAEHQRRQVAAVRTTSRTTTRPPVFRDRPFKPAVLPRNERGVTVKAADIAGRNTHARHTNAPADARPLLGEGLRRGDPSDRVPRSRDRGGGEADRPAGAVLAGDPPPDDRPRRELDAAGSSPPSAIPPVPDQPQARGLPRT